MASELGGTSGADAVARANESGVAAKTLTETKVNLGNYDQTAIAGGPK